MKSIRLGLTGEVRDMGMLNLMGRLLERKEDTSDTPAHVSVFLARDLAQLTCTLDTADTSGFGVGGPMRTTNVNFSSSILGSSYDEDAGPMVPDEAVSLRHLRKEFFIMRHVDAGRAVTLAERLELRDHQRDDRRLCLECSHMSGTETARRCAQWPNTGMPGPRIPADTVDLLQRCSMFNEAEVCSE
jgi:hypothetical protein